MVTTARKAMVVTMAVVVIVVAMRVVVIVRMPLMLVTVVVMFVACREGQERADQNQYEFSILHHHPPTMVVHAFWALRA